MHVRLLCLQVLGSPSGQRRLRCQRRPAQSLLGLPLCQVMQKPRRECPALGLVSMLGAAQNAQQQESHTNPVVENDIGSVESQPLRWHRLDEMHRLYQY